MQLTLSRPIYAGMLSAQVGGIVLGAQLSNVLFRLECPIRALTGLQCPGCGSSRCMSAIGSGDFVGALRHNPFLTLALTSAVLFGLFGFSSPFRASKLITVIRHRQRFAAVALVIMTLLFTIFRNLFADRSGLAI